MRLAILVLAVIPLVAQDTRTVTEPAFPPVCTQVPALSTAGDSSLDTTRIQAALNSCPAGQAVELRADGAVTAFFIGPIQFPPGVTLLLDVGVTVFGSRNPRDYDSSSARTCGTITTANTGCFPLITANRADGAGIMGYGTIDGRGHLPMLIDGAPASQSWWDLANAANTGSLSQNCPRMIQVSNTNGFTLYKVTLKNSPNFHVALGTDTNFTAWGIKIITPYDARNTDGIDPGYSNNVTVTQCHISDGDDNVAVGGSNSPGASNISVVNNFFGDGHGASIGSYTQAGVSNILFDHITFAGNKANGSATGIRIKSDVSRGGLVQNITYSNMCLQNVRAAIVLDPFYTSGATGSLIPQYKNITIQNVRSTTESTVKIEGHDAANNTTVTLNNVQIDGIKSTDITEQYVEYTLGPDPVNFAAFLKGTGVTVTNNISTSNTAYACPDAVFAPVAAELLPGPSLMFAGFPFFLTAQIYTTKAVPYQTWLANLKTDPNATLALPAPTGGIIVNDGDSTVGSAPLGAGQFVPLFVPWLSPGLHTLTASYTGDANYPPFTFGSYSVFVLPLWWLPALAELR